MQDLIVLSQEEYAQLKRELKAAGLDVRHTAESVRPIRMRWTPSGALMPSSSRRWRSGARLIRVIASPPCAAHPLATASRPARLTVTFHAVSPVHEAALAHYLATHPVSSNMQSQAHPVATEHTPATSATYVYVAGMLALINGF